MNRPNSSGHQPGETLCFSRLACLLWSVRGGVGGARQPAIHFLIGLCSRRSKEIHPIGLGKRVEGPPSMSDWAIQLSLKGAGQSLQSESGFVRGVPITVPDWMRSMPLIPRLANPLRAKAGLLPSLVELWPALPIRSENGTGDACASSRDAARAPVRIGNADVPFRTFAAAADWRSCRVTSVGKRGRFHGSTRRDQGRGRSERRDGGKEET